ncbi:MAG TPA: APC family permease [Polyangiaceae bacterium]
MPRPLGPISLLALGVNGVVGVGIFFAPASVAAELPGMAGVAAYVVTAMALLPIALSYSALGARFQVDGGPTVWADAAFGPRFAFFVGWLTFVSSLLSLAAVSSGLAFHASPLVGVTSDMGIRVLAATCTLSLASLASTGLRPSSVVWTAVTVLKLFPLFGLVAFGLARYAAVSIPATTVAAAAAALALSRHSLGGAVLIVVFALQGFEIVPLLAGSTERPERTVPLATVGALLIAAALYSALHALAVHAVPDLGSSHAPLAEAARAYGGRAAERLVLAGANLSALGIAFGMLNTTPRYLSALSGEMAFGPWIGKLDDRLVPQRALLLTALASALTVLLASRSMDLFVLSSLAVLAQFGATVASLLVLGLRKIRGLSGTHVALAALSLLGIGLVATGAEAKPLGIAAVVVAFGEVLRFVAQWRLRGRPAPS